MPTPRNLTKDLSGGSPWMRSLDVNMSDRYLGLPHQAGIQNRGTGVQDFYIVPQLSFHSPGALRIPQMRTMSFASPVISPPRQRRRLR